MSCRPSPRPGRNGGLDRTVCGEELPHLGARPRATGVAVRTVGRTTGPRMTEAVDLPEFQHLSATGVPPADGVTATAPGRHRTRRTGPRHPRRADRAANHWSATRRAFTGRTVPSNVP